MQATEPNPENLQAELSREHRMKVASHFSAAFFSGN
jgi:hypothetical protein